MTEELTAEELALIEEMYPYVLDYVSRMFSSARREFFDLYAVAADGLIAAVRSFIKQGHEGVRDPVKYVLDAVRKRCFAAIYPKKLEADGDLVQAESGKWHRPRIEVDSLDYEVAGQALHETLPASEPHVPFDYGDEAIELLAGAREAGLVTRKQSEAVALLLDLHIDGAEPGRATTYAALAKRLGTSRQSAWELVDRAATGLRQFIRGNDA